MQLMKRLAVLAAAALSLFAAHPAHAQTALGLTVSNCSAQSYSAGKNLQFTLTTTGDGCVHIGGTLPGFASTPTFNLGTLNGAASAANQTNGTQQTQIVDGSGNVIHSTSNNLNVQCANCSGSGVSTGDEASFTAGTSLFAGSGGFFQTTATNNALTTGQQGMFQVTANRALFTNLRNASGTEIGTASTPVQVSLANTGSNSTAVSVADSSTETNTSNTATNTSTIAGAVTASVMQANTKQVNGVTTLAGAGAVGTGAQRVAVGQDTTTIAGSAPGTAGTPSTNVVTVQGAGSMTPVLVTPSAPADPCFASAKLYADFESTSSGGSIITAVSAKKAYICSVTIITSAAANVSLIEGTGSSVCTGGTTAGVFLNTGVTAANGASFAANAGVTLGSGNGTLAANATANQNVCVAFTTTNTPQVNIHVSYVQQ